MVHILQLEVKLIFESFKTVGMGDFQVLKLSHGPFYYTVFILYLRFYDENWSNTDCNNIWCILQNENWIRTNQSVCQASRIWREQCFHFKIFKTAQKSINIFYHGNWKYNFQTAHSGSNLRILQSGIPINRILRLILHKGSNTLPIYCQQYFNIDISLVACYQRGS